MRIKQPTSALKKYTT